MHEARTDRTIRINRWIHKYIWNFINPFSIIDSRQKTIKDTENLNTIINQFDLIDIYRTFHPTATECTFFSSTHRTFTINHNLRYKGNIKSYKWLKSYKVWFLTIKSIWEWSLENPNIWKQNTYLSITHGSKKKPKGKLENILSWLKIKTWHIKSCGMQAAKAVIREKLIAWNFYIRGKRYLKSMTYSSTLGN